MIDLNEILHHMVLWSLLAASLIFMIYCCQTFLNTFNTEENTPKRKRRKQIKQDLSYTDYLMVLDTMLIYGIITAHQYNEYMSKGSGFFPKE